MGRLAGFKYREIVNLLKNSALNFTDKQQEVMKFGIILKQIDLPPFQII